ncbi:MULTISPECIES: hypothetical protein [Chryseobacterium]|uniref:Uncharacterized protein n=2 Tax=Chryseobacterium TaxID=59732 RepID=A0A543EN52_9FLAO|nr:MULTISPECIES: hypothetical protein [Chryseobacterium]MDR6457727.1 hypothetical protein [Chryseobacterium vietnamense]TQM23007.1 hypothetical protein FB551_2735 [Chryseobacterium aquifrigidense]
MKTYLKRNYQSASLFPINQKIVGWDLLPIEGKGLVAKFTGSDRYAHIELIMQKSDIDYGSEVLWNISENQIPYNFGHRSIVDETLTFFTNYVSGIKGKTTFLKFEITNIGIHVVDTRPEHFEEATMKAIVNCFDKTINPFNGDLATRISKQTLEYSRQHKLGFLKNEIIESLKIDNISEIFAKIFSSENIDLRMLNGANFNVYMNDSFEKRKVLLEASDIETLKKFDAINDWENITDIGKAHIAKILKDQYDMSYHFNIKFEDFNK